MSNFPKLTLESINRGYDWAILVSKSPLYRYDGGKRSSETPIGWKTNVILPGNCFAPLAVKVNVSADPLPEVTEEQIAAACAAVKPIFVRFTDCSVSVYAMDGLKMSATASAVELIKPGK